MSKPRLSKRQREFNEAFMMGALSAMSIVALHDQETIWREIAAACGGYQKLKAFSELHDQLDVDGFTTYGEAKP